MMLVLLVLRFGKNNATRRIWSLCSLIGMTRVVTYQVILNEKESDPGSSDDQPKVFAKTEQPQTYNNMNSTVVLSSISSLNTSEVQFKQKASFMTYEKESRREGRVVGQCVTVDTEVDIL